MLAIRLLEGTGTNISWFMWVALGFFIVAVAVGWLSSRKWKPEEPESTKLHENQKNG